MSQLKHMARAKISADRLGKGFPRLEHLDYTTH